MAGEAIIFIPWEGGRPPIYIYPLGTWIPFTLIFASTYLTGVSVRKTLNPKP